MKWKKVFGIKASVLLIYCFAYGFSRVFHKFLDMPHCKDYRHICGEDYLTKDFLDQINKNIEKDFDKCLIITKETKKRSDEFVEFTKKIPEVNKLDKKELLEFYKKLFKIIEYFIGISEIPVFIEDAVTKRILQILKEKGKESYFNDIVNYLGDSYINKEYKELLEIKGKDNYEELLQDHAKKYAWMGYKLFLGKPKEKKKFISRFNMIKDADKQLKEFKQQDKLKKRKYNKILNEVDSVELRKLAKISQELIEIRDYRYVAIIKSAFYTRKLLEKVGKLYNLDYMQVIHCLPEEILNGKINLNKIKERIEGFAIELKDKSIKLFSGKELKKFKDKIKENIENLNQLEGKTAYPGKVKGRVKVIIDIEDSVEFNKDNILVTNMTTPDFFSILNKTKAIVTDIGGITCHAAIMSRELKIPCIIGTEIATKIFKDGDYVEVDANRGIIRKVK